MDEFKTKRDKLELLDFNEVMYYIKNEFKEIKENIYQCDAGYFGITSAANLYEITIIVSIPAQSFYINNEQLYKILCERTNATTMKISAATFVKWEITSLTVNIRWILTVPSYLNCCNLITQMVFLSNLLLEAVLTIDEDIYILINNILYEISNGAKKETTNNINWIFSQIGEENNGCESE